MDRKRNRIMTRQIDNLRFLPSTPKKSLDKEKADIYIFDAYKNCY